MMRKHVKKVLAGLLSAAMVFGTFPSEAFAKVTIGYVEIPGEQGGEQAASTLVSVEGVLPASVDAEGNLTVLDGVYNMKVQAPAGAVALNAEGGVSIEASGTAPDLSALNGDLSGRLYYAPKDALVKNICAAAVKAEVTGLALEAADESGTAVLAAYTNVQGEPQALDLSEGDLLLVVGETPAEQTDAAPAETESETEVPAESESESELQSEDAAPAETESEDTVSAEGESESEAESELQSEDAAPVESESEAEVESESELQSEEAVPAEGESETEVENELQSEDVAPAESEFETEAESELQSEDAAPAVSESETEVESELQSEDAAPAESESETEAESELQSEDAAPAESESETEIENELQSEDAAPAENEITAPAGTKTEITAPVETESESETEVLAEAETESESEIEAEIVTTTQDVDGTLIEVSYPADAFEEEVTLQATAITGGEQYEEVENALNELQESDEAFSYGTFVAFDISFLSVATGEEVEPLKEVSVSIKLNGDKQLEETENTNLVHIPEESGKAEVVENAQISADATEVTFQNDEFSTYVLTSGEQEIALDMPVVVTAGNEEKGFTTLKAAVDEALAYMSKGSDVTVTLNQDLTGVDQIGSDETVRIDLPGRQREQFTLDLNGHKIDADGMKGLLFIYFRASNSVVTIKNGMLTGSTNRALYISHPEAGMSGETVKLEEVKIIGNSSTGSGGAICALSESIYSSGGSYKGKIQLMNSEISGNTAGSSGGGIYLQGLGTSSEISLVNSKINNNVSQKGSGGGIYVKKGAIIIDKDSEMSGNTAYSNGGAIYCDKSDRNAPVTVEGGRIIENHAIQTTR